MVLASACGDDAVDGSDGGPGGGDGGGVDATADGAAGGDAALGSRPHPLYPPLDLDDLPGAGGGALGAYEPPALPATSRSVTITSTGSQAAAELLAECQAGAVEVTVPNAAGNIGVLNLGNVDDCDVIFGSDVVMSFLVVGSLPGPTHAPAHRLRLRGGQIGNMLVYGDSSDLVFDGVIINNGVQPSGSRNGTGIYMPEGNGQPVRRFAFVNSIIRMLPVDAGGGSIDGTSYLAGNAENVLFANNNIVTAGNRNSWGFRLSGGTNTLIVDNTVRVSFHKLVRMNDNPVDYVYIKGGTWMREATLAAGGQLINDSFTQLSGSTTDRVYIHDPVVYLLADSPVTFGMAGDAVQAGKSWEARRIAWHAVDASVISDASLADRQTYCTAGATCDYGIGTHTYAYDPALVFPTNPWRALPTIATDDPDDLPIAP